MAVPELMSIRERDHLLNESVLPVEARTELRDAILNALTSADVPAFVIRDRSTIMSRIGLLEPYRQRALDTLATALPNAEMYMEEVYPDAAQQPLDQLTSQRVHDVPERCPAIRIVRLCATRDHTLVYGRDYGTLVEFWGDDPDLAGFVRPPFPNIAAQEIHRSELEPRSIVLEGRSVPSIKLFDRRFIEDVPFPVDAVYTWVDGSDPSWQERFQRARASDLGIDYHYEAHAEHRYVSRDELRYSLRSLCFYAPWIRHIYLVTDAQTPTWLNVNNSRLTVVDHKEIFRDTSVLPVFNSNAIISQLHHIDGLSEHYLYVNDDVFFGRDVAPNDFWYGSGVTKVFPSKVQRAFGPSGSTMQPHLNISINIRSLMEGSVGTSISNAIRHTPLPQMRSVNFELEQMFSDELRRTAARRFRHHDDVALDQLFHYYAQATGRAVPAQIAYDYVNVGVSAGLPRLRRLLAARDRSVFCLNDAPEFGDDPIDPLEVTRFLRSYFPFASEFEQ